MFIIENNNVLSRSIVAKDILDDLKKDIIVKNITPGTKLTEKYLLKKYEVSRVPVRSVLHTLAHQGFLKFGKNGVHYVPNFSIKYFEDVYDVRALLERNAVEIILKSNFVNYSPILQSLSILKEKSNLKKKNNKQNENIDIGLLTLSIHYHIVKVSDNKALLNAWNTIANFTEVFMKLNLNKLYLPEVFEDHNKFCSAIIQKSPNCIEMLEDHIMEAKKLFIDQYKEVHGT